MASLSTACSTFACWSTWQHHQSKVSKVLNVWCDQTWPMTASNLFLIDLKSSCSMAKALMILSLALTTRPSSSLRPCRITCCWCICGRKKLWTDLPPQRKFTPFRGSKIKVRVIIKQARGDKLVKRPKTCWAQYEETVHCSNEREKNRESIGTKRPRTNTHDQSLCDLLENVNSALWRLKTFFAGSSKCSCYVLAFLSWIVDCLKLLLEIINAVAWLSIHPMHFASLCISY